MRRPSQQQQLGKEQEQERQQNQEAPTDYFDLNVLKGAVSFNTKPFKHRALVWIGFKKVMLFPFCWNWWLARIPRLQFFLGCTLYALHNACAWLYVRGCLPPPPSRSLPPSWGGASAEDDHVAHVEVLLPYVIGCLFGIGYGSVVAAGGWEALRMPAVPDSAVPGAGGTGGESGDTSGSGGGGGGGAGGGGSGDTSGAGGCGTRGGAGAGGSAGGDDLKGDLSFAAQVCAWDSRADEEARADGEDYDEDDDFDSSGPGSDNDDPSEVVAPPASTAAPGQPTTRITRSQARSAGFNERFGGGDSDGGGGGDGPSGPVRVGDPTTAGSEPSPDSPPVHLPGNSTTENGGGVGDGSSNSGGQEGETAVGGDGVGGDGGGGGGGREPHRRVSLVHHPSSYDSAGADDEDDDEEDHAGWGQQVVVKPVKVARWDKTGLRSKSLLSLNQLRACIIERAESTPQKATYRRAAKLGVFATVCLPVLFALCTMVAYAWINASPDEEEAIPANVHQARPEATCSADGGVSDGTGACYEYAAHSDPVVGSGGGNAEGEGAEACGRLRLEELAVAGLWRAAEAVWALASRVLRPEAGDMAAAAVSTISLCSVAFFAVPTFRALEDAERTYQRRYMYSKYFCALTSSQRARKHRLPYFSLKNVANIRVWLALRAGKTWLRRHRRERKADAVVSSAFFLSLALLAAILSEAISREARFLSTVVHWELLVWCCFISFFLLRYLTLGSNTNNRYRDTSVLLTEQINVQLRILQNTSNREASKKAIKRERLGVSTNVLKLATKLLKELDGPNKLSGLSMNPVLYNVTRVVLVSALSGVMSDTLGFSVKLWKVISFK